MLNPGRRLKVERMYLITKDSDGHLHRYISSKASMHSDIISEYDIDLDEHIILEKGFIFNDHTITANYDIRRASKGCRKIR